MKKFFSGLAIGAAAAVAASVALTSKKGKSLRKDLKNKIVLEHIKNIKNLKNLRISIVKDEEPKAEAPSIEEETTQTEA
jgi:gas vesicle protein